MFVSFDPKIKQKLQKYDEMEAERVAFHHSQAMIEFDMDGIVLTANEVFLNVTGYSLNEIVGQHHSIFVDPQKRGTAAYQHFWQNLQQGIVQSDEQRFIGKRNREMWFQASYHPICSTSQNTTENTPYKVIALTTDITEQVRKSALNEGQIAAINRAQAVIHFEMDGTIIWANQAFLDIFGYELDEIRGRNQSMFVDFAESESHDYRMFWQTLTRGDFATNVYRRIGKGGREIWLDATYDPIFDRSGKPFRIVMFAIDVTERQLQTLETKGLMDAVNRSRSSISFRLDGTIIDANKNFLNLMGYTIEEIRGRHHSILVEPSYAQSSEYRTLWETVRAGRYFSSVFKQIDKAGHEVWVSATYNPIIGADGRPFKIVTFARNITHIVEQRHASEQLVDRTLERIVGAVASVNDRSTIAVEASGTTSDTVQAVAASAEQLNASILEIASSMSSSRNAVETVIHQAQITDTSTQRLSIQASTMTSVVELIEEIAKRINLLSLNATIESARAGEAGRGFAVVANQVKSLAQQVSSATGKISQEILQMQDVAHEVVDGLTLIKASIASVQDAVINTASAVEQQSAVTRDISANMQYAAKSVGSVNDSLVQILSAAKQANDYAHEGKDTYTKAIADVTVL